MDGEDSRGRKPKTCTVLYQPWILIYRQASAHIVSHCSKFFSSIFFKHIFLKKKKNWGYSCFAVLCWFLTYSRGNQLCVYTPPPSWPSLSPTPQPHRFRSSQSTEPSSPCCKKDPPAVCFTHGSKHTSIPICQSIPTLENGTGPPAALVVKNPPASAGHIRDGGSVPGSGRSRGGGHGNPLHYSCLGNPMDRGAWWATVHGVAKSQTRLM